MIDTNLDFHLPIQKTDETVIRFIKQIMKPSIQEYDGRVTAVPVLWNGAQRWVQVRRRHHLVDGQGNTLYPLISLSRTSTKRGQGVVNRFFTMNQRQMMTIPNQFSKNRPHDTIDAKVGYGRSVTRTKLMIPIPLKCEYEFQVYTDTNEQMNQILQSFFLYDKRWWIIDGNKIRVNFGDFSNTTQIQTSKQRLIKSNFTLQTYSTLFPKAQSPIPMVQKDEEVKKISTNIGVEQ